MSFVEDAIDDVGGFVDDTFNTITGKRGADAAEDAARTQAEASDRAIQEQRRQFDFITGLLDPFVQSGTSALAGVKDASTIGGMDDRLAQIFNTDIFKQVADKNTETATNALSQAGLSRSGGAIEELSRIPLDTALGIENSIFGRQQSLVNNGQNAAAGLGSASQSNANSIAELLQQQGAANAQGIIGAQQSRSQGMGNILDLGKMIGSLFFSDPKLKKNMTPIGKVRDLTLYEWEWVEEMPNREEQMSIGYSADEVEEKYPHCVVEVAGFKAINYPRLNDELEQHIHEAA